MLPVALDAIMPQTSGGDLTLLDANGVPQVIVSPGSVLIPNLVGAGSEGSGSSMFYDVREFGAIADSSVTDNAPLITAAADAAAAAGGGTVFIPDGGGDFYGLASLLNFSGTEYRRVRFMGEGEGSWIKAVMASPPGSLGVLHIGGDTSFAAVGIGMKGLRISCYNDTSDQAKILSIGFAERVLIEDLYFDTSYMEGIYFAGPSNTRRVILRNCHASRVGMSGLSAYNLNASYASLIGCTAEDVGQFVEHTGYGLEIIGGFYQGAASFGFNLNSTWSGWQDAGLGAERNSERFVVSGVNVDGVAGGAIVFLDPEGHGGYRGNQGLGNISSSVFKNVRQFFVGGTHADAGVVRVADTVIKGGDSGSSVKPLIEIVNYMTTDNGNKTSPFVFENVTIEKGSYPWNSLFNSISADVEHVIDGLKVYGKCWGASGGAAFALGGTKATLKDVLFIPNGDTLDGYLLSLLTPVGQGQNFEIGTTVDITQPFAYSAYMRSEMCGPGLAPLAGTWKVNDRYSDSTPSAGAAIAATCISPGTAGTLATTLSAPHTAGTAIATLTSIAGIFPGAWLTLDGSTDLQVQSVTGNVVTFTTTFGALASGVSVAYKAPVFKAEAAIAA